MSRIDLYTPWREPAAILHERTVGRDELVRVIEERCVEFAAGRRPLPWFLFGPRGAGKSHLIALLRAAAESRGVQVKFVPEDIPGTPKASALLRQIDEADRPTWMRRPLPPPPAAPRRPTLIIVEGLDKRLGEMSTHAEQQELRRAWDLRQDLWVVGTGVELSPAFTDRVRPFFGWFNPQDVPLFTSEQSEALLDRITPEAVRNRPHWTGRRRALVALAGGSPRVLATLAEGCAAPEGPDDVGEALLSAVDRFTAHYQLRFRDLAQGAQELVTALARSPRSLSPGELAAQVQNTPTTVATQARRLAEDGVLMRVGEAHHATYAIAEPLFRYWLEYRTGPWHSTRISIATAMLQELFSVDELARHWWMDGPSPLLDQAVTKVEVNEAALRQAREALQQAIDKADAPALDEALKRAGRNTTLRNGLQGDFTLLRALAGAPALAEVAARRWEGLVSATLRLAANLLTGTGSPRELFSAWLRVEVSPSRPPWRAMSRLLLDALDRSAHPGRPWRLDPAEQDRLARLPFFRAAFLQRGRTAAQPALLDPAALAGVPLGFRDPDLPELLVAALQIDNDALVERLLTVSTRAPPPVLPINPFPHRPLARGAAALGPWLLHAAVPWGNLETLLGWMVNLPQLEDAHREALFGKLAAMQVRPTTEGAQRAMTALGLADLELLQRLIGALPIERQESAWLAWAMADSLREADRGPLHPELEALRQALLGLSPAGRGAPGSR